MSVITFGLTIWGGDNAPTGREQDQTRRREKCLAGARDG
jgi:hypothetical protein